MRWLCSLGLLLSLWMSTPLRAEEDHSITHFVAHTGVGFALTTMQYGFFHKVLGFNRTTSHVLSFVGTQLISVGREAIQAKKNGSKLDWTDVRNTSLGSVAGMATIVIFDF